MKSILLNPIFKQTSPTFRSIALGIGLATLSTGNIWAVSATVDSVAALAPNPSNLAIVEVGNTSLANARLLSTAAHNGGFGGTIDFQQQFQGGTFPNATASANGVDVATDSLNPLQVTTFSSGTAGNLVASGPVIFSFYRSDGGNQAALDNIDSNTNQGGNIISGGYKSRDPIAEGTAVTGNVNFATVPPHSRCRDRYRGWWLHGDQ